MVICFGLYLGYRMYAVGVGNAVEDELKEIASAPEHYFYTADFKAINEIGKKLQINTCPGKTTAIENSIIIQFKKTKHILTNLTVLAPVAEDPCECESLTKFQKKVEESLQALTKKYILFSMFVSNSYRSKLVSMWMRNYVKIKYSC